jgi:hypothetical protein
LGELSLEHVGLLRWQMDSFYFLQFNYANPTAFEALLR